MIASYLYSPSPEYPAGKPGTHPKGGESERSPDNLLLVPDEVKDFGFFYWRITEGLYNLQLS